MQDKVPRKILLSRPIDLEDKKTGLSAGFIDSEDKELDASQQIIIPIAL